MLFANKIFSWNDFKDLGKDDMYTLKRTATTGSNIILRNHHALKISNAREYITFLIKDRQKPLANDPTKWG